MRELTRLSLNAFGLIEVCLSLIILGFIVTMSMNMTTVTAKHQRLRKQAQEQKCIQKALERYYQTNKSYPLPSGSDGISPDVSQTPPACTYSSGELPVKTLGLINISQNTPLRYAVIHGATRPPSPPVIDADDDGAGFAQDAPTPASRDSFHVRDSNGSPLIDERRQSIVVIVAPLPLIRRIREARLTLTHQERHQTLMITQPKPAS